jgi:ATP-dependent Clp protease ATP-binding subunit ClpC
VASEDRRAIPSTDLPLSAAALQLIADATRESARLYHEYIGTEHLLLALSHEMREQTPLAVFAVDPRRVFTRLSEIVNRWALERQTAPLDPRDLDLPEEVIQWIAEHSRSNAGDFRGALNLERPFTTRTLRALSFAADSARELTHTHISVADLIVGIMREGKSVAAQVLATEGLTTERAYEYARQQSA